jgi:UDP-N-acetyl-D-mannosaminuronic acid transferase (WecB/TagA/CpsF family)
MQLDGVLTKWTESKRTTPRWIYSSGLEWRHAIRPAESKRTTPRWIRSSRLEWRHANRLSGTADSGLGFIHRYGVKTMFSR